MGIGNINSEYQINLYGKKYGFVIPIVFGLKRCVNQNSRMKNYPEFWVSLKQGVTKSDSLFSVSWQTD